MRPVWLILGGVLVGVVVVFGAAAVLLGDDEPDPAGSERIELSFPAVTHDEAAATDLLIAWRRWRTATFVSTGTWTRHLDGAESPLTGAVSIAQEPPRRLVVRLETVTEQIDGAFTTCEGPSEDLVVPGCTEVPEGASYADRVESEMSLVTRYVEGDGRIYDVGRTDGCFQVALKAADLRSPWGRAAEFCFDPEIGAMSSSRVRRQTATDVETTDTIRSEVTDADF